jgi:zinc transport system permease protein
MVWVRNRTDLAADTTIGVFFALSMALGIVLLNLKEGYVQETVAILFGSILAVDVAALVVAATTAVLTLATLPIWKRWAYATFDANLAQSDRQPVTRDDYLLTIAIALVVVASIRVVGIVLIAAFLVLPAATARLLSRTFTGMTLLSIAIGVVTAVAGLYISYYADLPSGPAIVLLQGVLFAVALVIHRVRA